MGLHTSWPSNTLDFVISNADVNIIVCHKAELQKIMSPLLVLHTVKVVIVIGELTEEQTSEVTGWSNEKGILWFKFNDLLQRSAQSVDVLRTHTGAGVGRASWFGLHQYHSVPEDDTEIYTLLYTSG